MEVQTPYVEQMERLLKKGEERLDRVELRALGEQCRLFQSAYRGLYNVLHKKGIIHDDPYKHELKISEVAIPSESSFAESEKIDQMSVRLSQFDSYLDFLNNYYQFSVDFLSMNRIKRLIALVKYFCFTQFTETNQHVNTRCYAELVNLVRKGTDPLSTGIINESLLSLDRASREIFKILKLLTLFHKERYKLDLRRYIVPLIKIEPEYAITHHEDVIRQIKQKFVEVSGDKPFYAELAAEVLKEDYSSEGQDLKDEIIKQFELKDDTDKNKTHKIDYKIIILDGIRMIASSGFHLSDAIKRLSDNSEILESRDKGFWSNIGKLLAKLFNNADKPIVYEVDYLDPVSNERKEEKIDFTQFSQEVAKKATLLISMNTRNSPSYQRVASSSEEQTYKILEKSVEDVQRYYRLLYALDEFFKTTQTEPEERQRIKGIKVELESIKNAIIKANQKKHEYVSQMEEIEQMKRLGIKTES